MPDEHGRANGWTPPTPPSFVLGGAVGGGAGGAGGTAGAAAAGAAGGRGANGSDGRITVFWTTATGAGGGGGGSAVQLDQGSPGEFVPAGRENCWTCARMANNGDTCEGPRSGAQQLWMISAMSSSVNGPRRCPATATGCPGWTPVLGAAEPVTPLVRSTLDAVVHDALCADFGPRRSGG